MSKILVTLSDADLLRLIMDGDGQAFSEVYRRHHLAIYRFARLMSESPTIAEDVTQEVFMVLMREVSRYNPERGTVPAFLFGIARNCVRRAQNRDRSWIALTDGLEPGEDAASTPCTAPDNPLGQLARSETVKLVRQAVLKLPERYREVVVLCDLQEMSYAEAAGVLGCPIGTVYSRLHRARSLLRKKLRAALVSKSDEPASDEQVMRCFA